MERLKDWEISFLTNMNFTFCDILDISISETQIVDKCNTCNKNKKLLNWLLPPNDNQCLQCAKKYVIDYIYEWIDTSIANHHQEMMIKYDNQEYIEKICSLCYFTEGIAYSSYFNNNYCKDCFILTSFMKLLKMSGGDDIQIEI